MSQLLIEITRGGRVESRHFGSVAVANGEGRVLAYAGDPYMPTYLRSAAKPIQAMNAILSGAADRFGLTEAEIAVMCGSHYAEDFHREAVLSILRKIGLPLDALKSPAGLSIKHSYAIKQARENRVLDAADSNCSGKHSGFLAACVARGYPVEGYMDPSHPVQRDVLAILARMCDASEEMIGIGEDGCGVPVHYMPLYNMALGYARLAAPQTLPPEYDSVCERIFSAMNAAPLMVAGTGGFCSELIAATEGRLVAKLGAEAVYCIGVKEWGLGVAVKIEDGMGNRALNPTVMSVLDQLGLLSSVEKGRLERFVRPRNVNEHGHEVGEIVPAFELKRTYA